MVPVELLPCTPVHAIATKAVPASSQIDVLVRARAISTVAEPELLPMMRGREGETKETTGCAVVDGGDKDLARLLAHCAPGSAHPHHDPI